MAQVDLFQQALAVGRPPTIRELFPNSKGLIVSGKYINEGCILKPTNSIFMAVNARTPFVIPAALLAAELTDSVLMVEIAKSEGGLNAYCPIGYWDLAKEVDFWMNRFGITIPVGVHADHFTLKTDEDVEEGKILLPTLTEAGITSVALDGSHFRHDKNVWAMQELVPYLEAWMGLEVEDGEIKGKKGMSTVEEVLTLIRALNAHGIFPDWVALNNGTVHGILKEGDGIDLDLTERISYALLQYMVRIAQHGTSGSPLSILKALRDRTIVTKANVATMLQMMTYGLLTSSSGNVKQADDGSFIRKANSGVTDQVWAEMVEEAAARGYEEGNIKKLNNPFANRMKAMPKAYRERIITELRDFMVMLMTDVLNSAGTGTLAKQAIVETGSYYLPPKAKRLEDPRDWTPKKLEKKAKELEKKAKAAAAAVDARDVEADD